MNNFQEQPNEVLKTVCIAIDIVLYIFIQKCIMYEWIFENVGIPFQPT